MMSFVLFISFLVLLLILPTKLMAIALGALSLTL